jgi:hypothetical protein
MRYLIYRPARLAEKEETMTPSNSKSVTRTVFDLALFDDVKLTKQVQLPTKPATLEEALVAVGHDKEKLLAVIYEGLVADACDAAKGQIEGFVLAEDGDAGEAGQPYQGKYADEEKGKKINLAILALAKMNGYEKSLPAEKKAELKNEAIEFLRNSPKMLATIQS